MPRPPDSALYTKLPCEPTVDDALAIKACEAAAHKCGFHVAARTAGSVVLMPSPKHAFLKCLMPGCGSQAGTAPDEGRGITAELVPDAEGEGLAVSVASSRADFGAAFVSALVAQLKSVAKEQVATSVAREEMLSSSSRFRRESQAYYYYSKILYDTRQPPGQAAAEFVQSFIDKCNALSPTALEQGRLVEECTATVSRLCRLVEEQHRESTPSASSTSPSARAVAEFRPWLQGSVERCIFSRVGTLLWSLYESRHSAEDALYGEKLRQLASASDSALMEALEVRPHFRGTCPGSLAIAAATAGEKRPAPTCAEDMIEPELKLKQEDDPEAVAPSEQTSSTAVGTEESPNHSRRETAGCWAAGPYERASAALSQIEVGLSSGRGCSPRQVIEALSLSQLEMKTCAFEASHGQEELHAMDDVMPVFIFVLARSSLLRPFACSSFMQDALSKDERLDSEGRAVLLLESAARYITHEWELGDLGFESF